MSVELGQYVSLHVVQKLTRTHVKMLEHVLHYKKYSLRIHEKHRIAHKSISLDFHQHFYAQFSKYCKKNMLINSNLTKLKNFSS